MYLDKIIEVVEDANLRTNLGVRKVAIRTLRALDAHLEQGYVPTKDVQAALDELDAAIEEHLDFVFSDADDTPPADDPIDDEMPEDDEEDDSSNDDEDEDAPEDDDDDDK